MHSCLAWKMYNNHLFSIYYFHMKIFLLSLFFHWSLRNESSPIFTLTQTIQIQRTRGQHPETLFPLLFFASFSPLSSVYRIKNHAQAPPSKSARTHTHITLSSAVPPTIKINTHFPTYFISHCMVLRENHVRRDTLSCSLFHVVAE